MKKQCLTKPIWKSTIGANPKPKRLKLQADNDGLFSCPVRFWGHGRCHNRPVQAGEGLGGCSHHPPKKFFAKVGLM